MAQRVELQPEYESYLLRIWPGKTAYPAGCRLILQNVTTQQQHFFTDLTTLLAFLAAIVDPADRENEDEHL